MKRQVIKGYPWPEEKHSIAIRKAVIESDLLVKQAVSYDDGGTGVEKENLCGWIGLWLQCS